MILFLSISIIVLLIIEYFLITYLSWKKDSDIELKKISYEKILTYTKRFFILIRRGWYIFLFYTKKILGVGNFYFKKAIIKVVPSTEKALSDKDTSSISDHGPASFFLKEITDAKNGIKKRLSKNRKML